MKGIIAASRKEPRATVSAYSQTTPNASAVNACGDSVDQSVYKTGGSSPVNNDVVYTNSIGTRTFSGGDSYFSNGTWSYQISGSGVISNRAIC